MLELGCRGAKLGTRKYRAESSAKIRDVVYPKDDFHYSGRAIVLQTTVIVSRTGVPVKDRTSVHTHQNYSDNVNTGIRKRDKKVLLLEIPLPDMSIFRFHRWSFLPRATTFSSFGGFLG